MILSLSTPKSAGAPELPPICTRKLPPAHCPVGPASDIGGEKGDQGKERKKEVERKGNKKEKTGEEVEEKALPSINRRFN